MKKRLLNLALSAVGEILKKLPPDKAREVVDDMLDKVEKKIEESPSKIDDALVQPLLGFVRSVLSIPDDIGGDED